MLLSLPPGKTEVELQRKQNRKRHCFLSPGFYLQVKTGITVESTPQKKKNLLTEEAEKAKGERDRNRGETRVSAPSTESAPVLCQSRLLSRFLGQIWFPTVVFFFLLWTVAWRVKGKLYLTVARERERRVVIWTGSVWKIEERLVNFLAAFSPASCGWYKIIPHCCISEKKLLTCS